MGPKAACEAISKGKSKKGTVAAALGHQYVTTKLTVAHSSRTTLFDRLAMPRLAQLHRKPMRRLRTTRELFGSSGNRFC
jgi:hypothetical protein